MRKVIVGNTNIANIAADVHFSLHTEPQNVVLTCRKYQWDEQVNAALGKELDEVQLTFNYNVPLQRLPGKKNQTQKKRQVKGGYVGLIISS